MHGIDTKEDYLLRLGNGILDRLLLDRTTGENVIWATYALMGVIQPRVAKNEEERKLRARKMG